MNDRTPQSRLDGAEWLRRVREAHEIGERWAFPDPSPEEEAEDQASVAAIDPTTYVGSRHHTVPRFVLERWADRNGQVRIYHKVEDRHGTENVRDLAIRDFYTIVDIHGRKNSTIETLMGRIETAAEPHLDAILNPFLTPTALGPEAIGALNYFSAMQSVRTTRRRREIELHAEWYSKTMATGRIPDDELQRYSVAPHQNDGIRLAMQAAQDLLPYFMCRPLAIMNLGARLLYMCDEPVVLNAAASGVHTPDCFLTDEQIEARVQRRMRKIKKNKRGRARSVPGRLVHFSSNNSTGHGIADEIVLPISPTTALLWGPLQPRPYGGPVERVSLSPSEAIRFADMVNTTMCDQALDWVLTRLDDDTFSERQFPDPGPLLSVCDGANAASLAVNQTPVRFRPQRLWMPEPDEFRNEPPN